MGKPTYDELTKLYKDCELQRESLILENEELKRRIGESLKMIWDNYGVLDKYGIEMLEDILRGE